MEKKKKSKPRERSRSVRKGSRKKKGEARNKNVVFAIAAHPDDIEFMMAGTLSLLKKRGFEVHYMNIANGCYGTKQYDRKTIIKMRRQESMNACKNLGATFHPPICDDMSIIYSSHLLKQLASIIRRVKPSIILTQSPNEYMEDHTNTSKLVVSAAFCKDMPLYPVQPFVKSYQGNLVIYHSLPHGLRDCFR